MVETPTLAENAGSAAPSQLPFPPAVLQKLAPHSFLYGHLNPAPPAKSIRPNGRQVQEARRPHIHTGSLNNVDGSAIVRQDGTTALCGIKAEILSIDDILEWRPEQYEHGSRKRIQGREAIETLNLAVPNVELRTGCSWDNLPDKAPSGLAQTLSSRLRNLLLQSGVIDYERLVIKDSEAVRKRDPEAIRGFWVLYVDILLISVDGNLMDAAWTACMAAFQNLRLAAANWDEDLQRIVCGDDMSAASDFYSSIPPMHCSYSIFKSNLANTDVVNTKRTTARRSADGQEYWILADPDRSEEELCSDEVSMLLASSGATGSSEILHLEKTGGVTVGMDELLEIVHQAESRYEEWRTMFERLPKPG